MATLKDVAQRARVSIATVSHVINGTRHVSTDLCERVKNAMEILAYHPNAVARSLRMQCTHTIGLIVSDITNPFFSMLARGVEDACSEQDHSLIVCNSDENPSKEQLYCKLLYEKRVDGLLIAPMGMSEESVRFLAQRRLPFTFVDRIIEGIQADSVVSDNERGAYEATRHLLEAGHTRIGFTAGQEHVWTSQERFIGYKRALFEVDVPFDQGLVVRGNLKFSGGVEACKQLLGLKNPPSAIFVAHNFMVYGALKCLREKRLSCPKDLALVGFDVDWAGILDPPLTVVVQQPYEMGYQAIELLFHRIREKGRQASTVKDSIRTIRLETELRYPGSTTVKPTHLQVGS